MDQPRWTKYSQSPRPYSEHALRARCLFVEYTSSILDCVPCHVCRYLMYARRPNPVCALHERVVWDESSHFASQCITIVILLYCGKCTETVRLYTEMPCCYFGTLCNNNCSYGLRNASELWYVDAAYDIACGYSNSWSHRLRTMTRVYGI